MTPGAQLRNAQEALDWSAQLSQEREDADYVIAYRVAVAEYDEWRRQATALLERIRIFVASLPAV
mgnify:CR=1 FL=1